VTQISIHSWARLEINSHKTQNKTLCQKHVFVCVCFTGWMWLAVCAHAHLCVVTCEREYICTYACVSACIFMRPRLHIRLQYASSSWIALNIRESIRYCPKIWLRLVWCMVALQLQEIRKRIWYWIWEYSCFSNFIQASFGLLLRLLLIWVYWTKVHSKSRLCQHSMFLNSLSWAVQKHHRKRRPQKKNWLIMLLLLLRKKCSSSFAGSSMC